MPISFGSSLSSAVANNTFLDKTINDVKKGKLGLYKVSTDKLLEPTSIEDLQVFIAEIVETVGIDSEGDANSKIYSSNNYLVDGESHKEGLEKIDTLAGAQIAGILAEIAAGSKKLASYADDAAYEFSNDAGEGGDVYYNTTTGSIRFYDDVDATWKNAGQEIVGIQEALGNGDGIVTDFNLTNLPLSDESIMVFRNGVLVPKAEYSFSTPTITFNSAPALGQSVYVFYLSEGTPASPVVTAGTQVVIYHEVTGAEVIAKQITLPSPPATPAHVMVDYVDAGVALVYSESFVVSGSILSWNALLLDGVIAAGEKLRIFYFN